MTLTLYILMAMFTAGTRTEWTNIAREVQNLTVSASDDLDYSEYAQELCASASVQAIAELLADQGIQAQTVWQDGTLYVRLQREQDRTQAESLLRENAGSLPYVITTEGGDLP